MTPLLKGCLFILLASFLTLVFVSAEGNVFHRQKREWIIAPRKLKENHDYTGMASIARIRSDKENYTKIFYSLTGPGVNQAPVGVFQINENTGYVKITAILDREEIPFYHLKGLARYTDGTLAEKDLDLKITVLDVNDCIPIITAEQVGSVNESSAAGTVVMKVIATDADEENTLRSMLSYSIVEHSSTAGMFYMNSRTGEVMVQRNSLDRERQDTYKLTIRASDLNGQAGGNTGTGEIQIKILDINDNVPTLEKESYEGSVQENTINVEVMRIKALDKDLMYSANWLAVFEIISGNEGGYFSISTDSMTNEGIIMINKALDYEELKVLNLEVSVSNKAAYNFGSGSSAGGSWTSKSYPITINVVNQKEGPRFQPSVKVVTISEDHTSISFSKIITNYAAIDSDTLQIATNVRYAKLRDDDNWLNIDVRTADIRLNKIPDRESKFLINGTYYAKIICITNETPSKTATGTIAIQVEDFNDHCPKLTATTHTMCIEDQVIFVAAVDADEFPNSAPFDFTVIHKSSKGHWKVEPLNETVAIFRDEANLWPGIYKIAVEIKDQQGKSCADLQVMDVTVCTCAENTKTCVARRITTSSFGASGILLLLLGLLLLLLVPLLLLFCLCGGAAGAGDFKAIPFDTKQQLISYHTEGQGEDKEVPLLTPLVEVDGNKIQTGNINVTGKKGYLGGLLETGGAQGGAQGGGAAIGGSIMTTEDIQRYSRYNQGHEHMEMDYMNSGMMTGQEHLYSRYRAGAFDGMALSELFLGEYYSSKSDHAAQQSQEKDALLVYDYEGRESLAGSVGCCSLLEKDDDLAFLDDLGPKFKTLADICRRSTLVTETVDANISVSPFRPVSPIRPSTHTHTHTHTGSIRDRDHFNINTLNTSNVASGSSTFVQEERITENSSMLPKVHFQDQYVYPSQTLLIQQPTMYMTAAPMYVVDPKPQMVLVSGTQQAVGQMGSVGLGQGLVQVGGIQGPQGVVLVDRQVGMGGATGHVATGLSHGTTSRKVLVVENGSSGGEQVAHLAQGFVQTGHGAAEQGVEVRGQGMQVKSFSMSSRSSAGSHEDILMTAAPKVQGSQRVVVQHKKVSVTERNSESSTRA
ncbi:desmoglein-2-like [Notolabrus celidotus]|uniref:desmoglein-2-like n=1 Tax=Notolabrus celidotus TaxID=1203425 RepID=UPI00148F5D99|nr:desmoglein-2-like [Notolabrus celidotus]